MNLRRIMAIAERLTIQILRDKRACALILLAPLFIMSLLAAILKSDSSPPRVAIQTTPENFFIVSALSDMLSREDEEGSGFTIVSLSDSISPEKAIKEGITDAVMTIPENFIPDRAEGKRSKLTLTVEGADPMRSISIFSRFKKAIPDSMAGMPRFMPPDCGPHCIDSIPDGPPSLEIVKIYGQNIDETTDFFTPVLPPFFVFFFVFILSGLSFLRERVGGTAERLLASPLKKPELVSGYIIGFLAPALIQAAIVILFARYVLGGPWGGWVVVYTTLLICLVSQSLGVFVSAFAKSEFQVFQFIPIIILPQALLSGIIWPVTNFPLWLKSIAYCLPLTYAVNAIRDVTIRGLGFSEVWPDTVMLILFTALSITLAAASVRRAV